MNETVVGEQTDPVPGGDAPDETLVGGHTELVSEGDAPDETVVVKQTDPLPGGDAVDGTLDGEQVAASAPESLHLKRLTRRSWGELDQDGLNDLLATCAMVWSMVALGSSGARVILVGIAPLAIVELFRWLRSRYTYPRIGYVRPRDEAQIGLPDGVPAWAVMGSVIAVALFMAALGARIGEAALLQLAPLPAAAIFCCWSVYHGSRTGHSRYYVYAALAAVGGLSLPFAPADAGSYVNLFLLLLPLSFVTGITGLVTFLRFVRTHPVVEAGEADGR